MKTMILAAAAVLALGVGSAAYAESEGGTATGEQWQARNGNALVPSTEWFAATPAQRQLLSHGYTVQPFSAPTNYAGQTPSHS
jgi:hypothetical protein